MVGDETFGQRVRRLRKFRRWTQERLVEEAELDQSTVSQVERDYGVRNIATVRRAELVRAHTRGGVLDREGYRQAVAAVLRR